MTKENITPGMETTIYEQMTKKQKIRVVTKIGWASDICHFTCSQRIPGGLWVTKKGKKCFVPFDSIDHIEVENDEEE